MPLLRSWLGEMLTTSFPATRMAFAYGSGVFSQQTSQQRRRKYGVDEAPPMIDLVLAVDDPIQWHKENIENNRHHYSMAAYGGAPFVSRLQDTAARVWYNALVPIPAPWGDGNQLMKYGVISSQALKKDLKDWSSFYISGRMQKPVAWIDGYEMQSDFADFDRMNGSNLDTNNRDYDLAQAGKMNLRGAVAAALLLLPNNFTEGQLYETITGLSYAGDFRMAIAENPDKVMNIVHSKGSPIRFRKLYSNILKEMETFNILTCLDGTKGTHDSTNPNNVKEQDAHVLGVRYEQDGSPIGKMNVLRCIPMDCQQRMSVHLNAQYGDVSLGPLPDVDVRVKYYRSTENEIGALYTKLQEQLEEYGENDTLKTKEMTAKAMQLALSTIVSQTAMQQTMKGLVSAGVNKSATYAMNKIQKRLK